MEGNLRVGLKNTNGRALTVRVAGVEQRRVQARRALGELVAECVDWDLGQYA